MNDIAQRRRVLKAAETLTKSNDPKAIPTQLATLLAELGTLVGMWTQQRVHIKVYAEDVHMTKPPPGAH